MEKVDLETGIDDSGLLSHQVVSDAEYAVSALRQEFERDADWQDEVRADFHQALNEARPDVAVALVHAAMLYAYTPDAQFELLNLQGIGLTKMIEAGGVEGPDPLELLDFRVAAFEKALQALPPDRGWDNGDVLCRIRLAMAWQEAGAAKADLDLLDRARAEYAELLPALREGRWGYAMHAKTAEIAALLAQTSDDKARLGGGIDPLPLWLEAVKLALDPQLRANDTLGYWDAAMELIEPWLERLPDHPDSRNACAEVRDVLQALNLPPDNPDHGWVQHFIGKMALAAGLQADGLRSEAKDADDETELLQSVAASRLALAAVESGDSQGWISTAFHLAYAFHALGEARRDVAALDEAIGLYQQVAGRLADPAGMEEDLHLAQVRMNLSEAMAQKGEIIGDAALARDGLNIATDAQMTFTLWGHDDGFEVAQANCERISAIIDVIESR